jgi:hypothetical protein
MKYLMGKVLAIVVGILIGFFGVFNSVFSDSSGINERLITIGIILFIFVILSVLWGYFLPKVSWQWGLFLSFPGVLFLFFYILREFNTYYILYILLLFTVSCIGAYFGTKLNSKER